MEWMEVSGLPSFVAAAGSRDLESGLGPGLVIVT